MLLAALLLAVAAALLLVALLLLVVVLTGALVDVRLGSAGGGVVVDDGGRTSLAPPTISNPKTLVVCCAWGALCVGACDAVGGALAASEAGVNTITVPSTVVRKLRKPRTVTVGRAVCATTACVRASARATYTGPVSSLSTEPAKQATTTRSATPLRQFLRPMAPTEGKADDTPGMLADFSASVILGGVVRPHGVLTGGATFRPVVLARLPRRY